MGDPFLTRMSVNKERTSMLLGYDDNTCEWCSIDDTGRIDGRQSLSEPGTASERHTQHMQFIGKNQVLVITQDKAGKWLHIYENEEHAILVQSRYVKFPFPVMQAARQEDQLLLLFSIRHRSGSVRIGLYDPDKDEARWVTPDLHQPQFVFWSATTREVGVNVGGFGRVYSYSEDILPSSEIPYTEYAYPVMDKQGDLVAVSIPVEHGFQPGWIRQGEGTVHVCSRDNEPFSELIRMQLDPDQPLVLCEGITSGRWQYVQYTLDREKRFELRDYPGILTQAVLSRDRQGLIGKYESIVRPPAPGLYRFSEQISTITPFPVERDERIGNHLDEEADVIYGRIRYGQDMIPYMDMHPEGAEQVVIYLHGGPHNCLFDSFSPVIRGLYQAGVRVIGLNYPGSSGFGTDYKMLIQNDWGGVDADVIQFMREQMLSSYSNVSLYGVSYGAYLALLVAGKSPALWSNVVACAPFTDLEGLYAGGGAKLRSFLQTEIGELLHDPSALRDRSPTAYISGLSKVDIQFIHGQEDQLCPVEQTERLYRDIMENKRLSGAVGRIELHIVQDMAHEAYSERFWAQKAVDFQTYSRVST
ncbi:prolyl oligopeptidase family serine peptidase [Paenibacillus sp. FSL R5-0517]|uniref:alpha/beta hydrolase family protein n=1 Tax=Paenibacillus sp. FSL R5-0517 TaxID=2921647 RepID=UPI0030DA5EB6